MCEHSQRYECRSVSRDVLTEILSKTSSNGYWRDECENPSALVTIVMCLFNLRISLSLLIGIMM